MSDNTKISWSDATWSPVTGCTKTSEGCTNCYIDRTPPFRMAHRRFDGPGIGATTGVKLHSERLGIPQRWRKPRMIFVCSLADLFQNEVPTEFIAEVFAVISLCPQHTFQVLTKRHARMRALLNSPEFWTLVDQARAARGHEPLPGAAGEARILDNAWIGVSCENQRWADIRIPALLDTPAAVRWISAEPLLGPIVSLHIAKLSWVVAGGESGHDARPMHPDWARRLRDQAVAAGVPFHFKQHGQYITAAVKDDPQFAGGRYVDNPRHGGRSAVVIRERGASGTFRSGETRPMRPGDRTQGGAVMLDEHTVAFKVGKGNAGRELDGRTWDEFPRVVETVSA